MGIIQLADVPKCSCEVSMFYHRYREPISRIRTIEQRNNMLSVMQEDFEKHVRAYPQERNEYSETYQLLKRKCMEVL